MDKVAEDKGKQDRKKQKKRRLNFPIYLNQKILMEPERNTYPVDGKSKQYLKPYV